MLTKEINKLNLYVWRKYCTLLSSAAKVAFERWDKETHLNSGVRFSYLPGYCISRCVTLFLFSDQLLKKHELSTVTIPSLSASDIWAGLWTHWLFYQRMKLPKLRCSSWLKYNCLHTQQYGSCVPLLWTAYEHPHATFLHASTLHFY